MIWKRRGERDQRERVSEREKVTERKMISIPYRIADRARAHTIIHSMWLNSITVKFTIQLKQIF